MRVWMKWSPQISHIYMKTIRAEQPGGGKKRAAFQRRMAGEALCMSRLRDAQRLLLGFVVGDVFPPSRDNDHVLPFDRVLALLINI